MHYCAAAFGGLDWPHGKYGYRSIPGHRHHVARRDNGRTQSFFADENYVHYRDLLAEHCAVAGVEVCLLMPNHVHLIFVPPDVDGLRRALAAAHRRVRRLYPRRLKAKSRTDQPSTLFDFSADGADARREFT